MSCSSGIRSSVLLSLSFSIGLILATAATPSRAEETATSPGEALYRERCATCHEGGVARAPDRRRALRQLSPERTGFALAYFTKRQAGSGFELRPDRRHRAVPGGRSGGGAPGATGFRAAANRHLC